jgi:hypothetical protein
MRWDLRRAYLEGLDQDESVPFAMQQSEMPMAGLPGGFRVRENVDAGVEVIDLSAMRAELEAGRRQKGGG